MAGKFENITGSLSKSECFCVNELSTAPFSNLFVGDHTLVLKSDADEQLILHLALNQTHQLKNIEIGVLPDDSCPRTIKLFVNRNNLGFSEVTELPPTQEIVVDKPEDGKPRVVNINLNAAKWQRVESVTLFVEDNHGEDYSSLYSLKIYGAPIHGTNVANIHNNPQQG